MDNHQNIPLEDIHDNPFQGRTEYTDIESLGRSIANDDLKEFPRARQNGKGVQLQFGHRRREAFQWLKANWKKEGLPDRYEGYTVMPLFLDELSDEAMFRSAVIENEHRKELNPIEQAEMMRVYRDQFGKNSDEIGALFGMNGATVRGKVRLLDLPEVAQKALSAGKISEGTARSLLSAQKVLDEKSIQDTLKNIEKNEGQQLPEEVIGEAIDDNPNVLIMANRWDNEKKPRAGRGLWLLDMKNFPNKMLEHLTPGGLEQLGVVDHSFVMTSPHLTDYLLDVAGAVMPDEQLKAKIDHLRNPPACNTCPFYTTLSGVHYCGMKACHSRKKDAFIAQKLADMSRTLKIDLYSLADGKYLVLDHHIPSHKKAFTKRHADLRLLPKHKLSGYHWQSLEGVDDGLAFVVAVGESVKTLKTKQGGSKASVVQAKTNQQGENCRRLLWDAAAHLTSMLAGLNGVAIEHIQDKGFMNYHLPKDVDEPDDFDALDEYARREMAYWMLERGHGYEISTGMVCVSLLKAIQEDFESWGVKFPKSLAKVAAKYDAEVEPVAVETKKSAKK